MIFFFRFKFWKRPRCFALFCFRKRSRSHSLPLSFLSALWPVPPPRHRPAPPECKDLLADFIGPSQNPGRCCFFRIMIRQACRPGELLSAGGPEGLQLSDLEGVPVSSVNTMVQAPLVKNKIGLMCLSYLEIITTVFKNIYLLLFCMCVCMQLGAALHSQFSHPTFYVGPRVECRLPGLCDKCLFTDEPSSWSLYQLLQ